MVNAQDKYPECTNGNTGSKPDDVWLSGLFWCRPISLEQL